MDAALGGLSMVVSVAWGNGCDDEVMGARVLGGVREIPVRVVAC